jgi:hypothetical protein
MSFLFVFFTHVCGASILSALIVDRFANGPFLESLLNARIAIPSEFPIYVVTEKRRHEQIKTYARMNIALVENIAMPETLIAYSDLFTSCALWEKIKSDYVLVFQADSRFCSASPKSLDFFIRLSYDWIGAPWPPSATWDPLFVTGSLVGNGGLSLRKRNAMLRCCLAYSPRTIINEDVYFVHCLNKSRIATVEHAELFSAETYFSADRRQAPFGIHKSWSMPEPNQTHLHNLCPEGKVAKRWFV